MGIELIVVPYDSGQRGARMGAGPLHLLEQGAAARLGARTTMVEAQQEWRAEVATAFALNRLISARVGEARSRGDFPLVVAGNCGTALGTVAGVGEDAVPGVLWLDAHGDLNTPETTRSGFLDGMALAILLGECWAEAAATVPGFRPVPAERVALVGARDLDPPEERYLAASAITRVDAPEVRASPRMAGVRAAAALRDAGARSLYLHVDLDVHDAAAFPANAFAAPGGLLPAQTLELAAGAASVLPLAAAALTAFDPSADRTGAARAAALELLEGLGRLGAP